MGNKLKVAIVGPGNIGLDLMYKVIKCPKLEMRMMAGIISNSKGQKRATDLAIGTVDDLEMAHKYGCQVVRVATHEAEADIAEQHVGLIKELGMESINFLMMGPYGSHRHNAP